MVIRKELDNAIANSASSSAQWREALKLRANLDTALANGFVDRPVKNKSNPIYIIDRGRVISNPGNRSFQLKDEKGAIVGGGRTTVKEQKLLDLLVNNQGNFVNYSIIKKEVWGYDDLGEVVMRQCVRRLRVKLEPDNEDPRDSIIQNVHGTGYRLAVSVDVVDMPNQSHQSHRSLTNLRR